MKKNIKAEHCFLKIRKDVIVFSSLIYSEVNQIFNNNNLPSGLNIQLQKQTNILQDNQSYR